MGLQSLVCTPEGGCVSSTTFEVASTYSCFTAQYEREVGNRYRVDQVRELVEIETYLTLDTETTVTFSLFESETDTGTYDLVLSKERVVSAMPSGGFASSGPLYFPLQPGRYYLIMARPDGEFGACTSYAGSGVPFGEFGGGLSWGEESVRGSVMVSWYPGSFGVYYQRLTFAE